MRNFRFAIHDQIKILGACKGTVIKRIAWSNGNEVLDGVMYKIDAAIEKYSGWYLEIDLIPCDLKTDELVKLVVNRENQP